MTSQQTNISFYEKYLHQFNFFKNYHTSPRNNAVLSDYFFEEFSKSPEKFSEFLTFYRESLLNALGQEKICLAEKYLAGLSSLCERFGLFNAKMELDDIAFQIINPTEYKEISESLKKYQKDSKEIIEEIYKIFEKILKEHKIEGKVEGRYKNIYSIYRKCQKKQQKNIFKLNDIFAFRIILAGEKEQCFNLLNILHDKFIPIPARFKDYISIPKINGYQSLHTGIEKIISKLDIPIEVQIRTETMHGIAESGIAAHYLYAREKKTRLFDEKEKKLFEHFRSLSLSDKLSFVYCLTPKGDILKLQRGSSALDFAEKIHTKLRKNAKFSLVNGEKKSLHHKINNLEIIEIIT